MASDLSKSKRDLMALSLVVLVACVFGADATPNGADVTTVYFVPFEIETYVPITRETVASQAWERWTISSKSQTSSLIALLTHGFEAKFDESRVRGSVCSKNQMFFVDADGVVSTNGKSIRIDKGMFIKFRDSLDADQRKVLNENKD